MMIAKETLNSLKPVLPFDCARESLVEGLVQRLPTLRFEWSAPAAGFAVCLLRERFAGLNDAGLICPSRGAALKRNRPPKEHSVLRFLVLVPIALMIKLLSVEQPGSWLWALVVVLSAVAALYAWRIYPSLIRSRNRYSRMEGASTSPGGRNRARL
jgi:hypothetical protein